MPWWLYALGAAVTAALTAICIRMSVSDMPPLAATALRTAFVLPFVFAAAGVETAVNGWKIGKIQWGIFVLAGLMNALSWICYTQAMVNGKAAAVSAVDKFSLPVVALIALFFLGETLTVKQWLGIALTTGGIILMIR